MKRRRKREERKKRRRKKGGEKQEEKKKEEKKRRKKINFTGNQPKTFRMEGQNSNHCSPRALDCTHVLYGHISRILIVMN